MDNQSIFFANSNGLSSSQIQRIEGIALQTFGLVAECIPITKTDVILHVKPTWTIPELGIGGYSPSSAYAMVHFDPVHPDLDANIATELAPTIAHELHHCARYGGVGYGSTLLGALVTEGLACCFETEFRKREPPIYATALDVIQISNLLA